MYDVTANQARHRFSTIVNAHKVFVISEGRVVESGNHESLIKAGGKYASMWSKQVSGTKSR